MAKQTKTNMNRKRTKRGQLSEEERAFIINTHNTLSKEEIASKLNRSVEQVEFFIVDGIRANSAANKVKFEDKHKLDQQGIAVVMTEQASDQKLFKSPDRDKEWIFRQPGT